MGIINGWMEKNGIYGYMVTIKNLVALVEQTWSIWEKNDGGIIINKFVDFYEVISPWKNPMTLVPL